MATQEPTGQSANGANDPQSAEKKQVKREFGLSSLAVNNRTSVVILTFIITVLGIQSYIGMPKESFPEIVFPTIYVGTPYPGNSPLDIENLVTRPIEKELKSLTGVKDIKSTSIQDYSTIIVEFNTDVEIPKALQDVKDAVDKAKSELPTDLDQDPNVFDIDLSELPIMFINVFGNYSLDELKTYAEYLEDEIEKLTEISKVELRGALEREIQINADPYKMEAMNVSFSDIANSVAAENVTLSGGNIKSGKFERSLRVDGEFTRVRDIEGVIVKTENDKPVYLKDVATVVDTYEDRTSFARASRKPVIVMDVVKKSGENLINASDKIKEILAVAKKERLPEDLSVSISNDQSKQTRSQVSNLENSIIFGVILVILVLMFFLGLRNALFVGVAIPLSMFISFMILNAFGVTLNLMVLFSLILALGLLVDNGIVVVENIYRLMQEGYSPIRAAKEGVGEVALPIITSTATTLAAFVPLAFWGGIIGQFMKFLPITLIVVLSSSLFVGLVVNPVLTAMFMVIQGKEVKNVRRLMFLAAGLAVLGVLLHMGQMPGLANLVLLFAILVPFNVFLLRPAIFWFQERFLVWLEGLYNSTLMVALRRPWLFFIGAIFTLFAAIAVFGASAPKTLFFPENEPNFIYVYLEKPIGSKIEVTNALTEQVEVDLLEVLEPYNYMVESFVAQVGEGTEDPNTGTPGGVSTPNKARLTIAFLEYQYRQGQSTQAILDEVRGAMNKYPGVQVTVDKEANGPPVGKPINIEVIGEDYEKLIAVSDKIYETIENAGIAGIEELKTDLETGKPELIIDIDRDKAQRFGLSTSNIAQELRTALFGLEVSKFKDGEEEYPIQLRLDEESRNNINALLNKKISFRDQFGKLKVVPIAAVANVDYTSTYGSVKRKDLDRAITIYSNVEVGYNPTEINNELKVLLADLDLPEGYSYKFTGEQEEQAESMAFLMSALLIAVFVIFLIIVAQFNSLTTPFIIMMSVLFSTIGVLLGLVAFNMEFVVIMTGIGIISLAGVVVNNAIVLIDYTNLVRARRRQELGLPEGARLPREEYLSSIATAGKTRLRPVLLTAITTVLGLVPLATGMNINFVTLFSRFDPQFYMGGDNADFWGPMAWTVIFGLVFATFLTLVIVPVMYLLADRLKFFTEKIMGKKPVEANA